MCGVVPGQSAPLMRTRRPFQKPTVFRQLQTQSAESISSEQAVSRSGLLSAALLCRWSTLFIAGVSPVPCHRHTKKGGCFLFRTCPATHSRFHTNLRWLCVLSRNVWFCCDVHPGYGPMPMTVLISLCDIRPWNKLLKRRSQSLWPAVPPEQLRRHWANTGTKPRAKLQGESGAPFFFCFYFVLQTTEQQFILMT